jgi:coenzyme PQQ precursor peptide PqqA
VAGKRTLGRGGKASLLPSTRLNVSIPRSHAMKWETPQASDMRYGFEITMYIATR